MKRALVPISLSLLAIAGCGDAETASAPKTTPAAASTPQTEPAPAKKPAADSASAAADASAAAKKPAAGGASAADKKLAQDVRTYLSSIGMVERYGITKITADGGHVTVTTNVGNDAEGEYALNGVCTETVSPLASAGPAVAGVERATVIGVGKPGKSDVLGSCERP